jgi:hypothetical protein
VVPLKLFPLTPAPALTADNGNPAMTMLVGRSLLHLEVLWYNTYTPAKSQPLLQATEKN